VSPEFVVVSPEFVEGRYYAIRGVAHGMSDTAWVSNAMNYVGGQDMTTDKTEEDSTKVIAIMKRNESGESLSAEHFPKYIWPGRNAKRPFKRIPRFFQAGGYWVVDKPVADILRQFDMGKGALYPVKIFQKDRTTQVDGDYFCINFGNVKQAFLPEDSSDRMMKRGSPDFGDPTYYLLPFVPRDLEMFLSFAASEGPDIWVDPLVVDAFFISDPLRTALKKAKLDGAFRLFKCQIIVSA
jgi:hypothetical protein